MPPATSHTYMMIAAWPIFFMVRCTPGIRWYPGHLMYAGGIYQAELYAFIFSTSSIVSRVVPGMSERWHASWSRGIQQGGFSGVWSSGNNGTDASFERAFPRAKEAINGPNDPGSYAQVLSGHLYWQIPHLLHQSRVPALPDWQNEWVPRAIAESPFWNLRATGLAQQHEQPYFQRQLDRPRLLPGSKSSLPFKST